MMERIRLTNRESAEPLNDAIDAQVEQLRANIERLNGVLEKRKPEGFPAQDDEKEGVKQLADQGRKIIMGVAAITGAILVAGIVAPDAVMRANEAARRFLVEEHFPEFMGVLSALTLAIGTTVLWDDIKKLFKRSGERGSR